ncbi:bactofilin family protein [Sneathiella chinensis]|uniref:Cell shape determination protein CcmA n=1 Tax=Sneathiella chinensis TaxID=349750 RepID=A0ABQ5TZE9_9PROT|nr:polymer-forming cytoskeletal protein [Sneathiella chinensis]GLQ05372.1 hypothetical protein GCM10007924_05930 [Sneathiella chinensis]
MFNKKKAGDTTAAETPADTSASTQPSQASQPVSRVKPVSDPDKAKPYATATATSPFPLNTGGTRASSDQNKDQSSTSRLHVGKDIHLKGEITACDRLVVEGKVEASMNSKEIEITESGMFNGEVTIDTADISGEFEGTLTARSRLIIRKTGRVSGIIEYGEIEIEPGAEISGNLHKTGSKKRTMTEMAESIAGKLVDKSKKEDGITATH